MLNTPRGTAGHGRGAASPGRAGGPGGAAGGRERRRGDGRGGEHRGGGLPAHEQHRRRQLLADRRAGARSRWPSWRAGAPARRPTAEFYRGHASIPPRGPLAANTVAGAISGWDAALAVSKRWGGRLPLSRILADAISYGRNGAPVTVSQHKNTTAKLAELKDVPGYAGQFLVNGEPPAVASLFRQPRLAATLERLARAGLDDFYRGEIAAANAAESDAHREPGDGGGPPGAPCRGERRRFAWACGAGPSITCLRRRRGWRRS